MWLIPSRRVLVTAFIACAFASFGCGGAPPVPEPPVPFIEADRSVDDARESGIHLEWMDMSVSPAEDIFEYACGNWVSSAVIPEGWSSYSGFDEYYDVLTADLLSLLDSGESFRYPDAELARVLFRSGLDVDAVEAADLAPLETELGLIDRIDDIESLSYALGYLHVIGVTPFFKIHEPLSWELLDRNYLYLRQTSLGTADGIVGYRDVDDELIELQRSHVSDLLIDLGYGGEDAVALADGIMNLEQRLGSSSMSEWELLDFQRNYNPMSYRDMCSEYPSIAWNEYFRGLGTVIPERVVVGQQDYFSVINDIVAEGQWELIRAYLKWALVEEFSFCLSSRFALAANRFDEATGAGSSQSREVAMVSVVKRELPDVLGTMYLERFFPESTRERVEGLIANLTAAYDRRLRESTWLDERTRAFALAKLANVRFAIGGREAPDYYQNLVLHEDSFLPNIIAVRRLRMGEHLSHLDEPASDDVWFQEAFNANRWSLPSMNTVLLPAAGVNELFRAECDDAYNYGAFGSTIAHEITHLFDRTGRGIDHQCRYRNWWTGNDLEQYDILAASLANYYENLGGDYGMELDGEYMFDENYADVMGLRVAHDAYMISLGGSSSTVKNGFTGEQRLLIANAQKWRIAYSDEGLRESALQWHSPGKIRACGPALLCEGFYEAFLDSCQGDASIGCEGLQLIW